MKNKKLNKITLQNENFSQWYTDVVINANLADYGSVKGMMIFKPYGYAIWENIQKILDQLFKAKGIENVYFPLLIPKHLFMKEKEHIEGFAPELATVTKVGDKVLEEELYIRPTSEVLFGNYFAKEIQGYRDLPLLYNQWANVLRWEKTTRPFLRTSEFLWQEGHTVHASDQEAHNFTVDIINLYADFAKKYLSIPVIVGQKTEKEKFAGAEITYTIEALMHDGQALQAGTSHYFGQNFTKVYDIKFSNKENKQEFAYSTSWGVSTRLIGALIMTHSDDNGLVLPPHIAPIQIAIIPVNDEAILLQIANEIKDQLKPYKVLIDLSDKSFGYRISEQEIKGVPLRIEIGKRDLENNQVTIARRDTFEKQTVALDQVKTAVDKLLNDISDNLYKKALNNRENNTRTIKTFDEYEKGLLAKNALFIAPFCGEVACENEIKQKTSTNSRCIILGTENTNDKCFKCNTKAKYLVYFARAY